MLNTVINGVVQQAIPNSRTIGFYVTFGVALALGLFTHGSPVIGQQQLLDPPLDAALIDSISSFEKQLTGSAKDLYETYLAKAPLPHQRLGLIGKWHGETTGDPDEKSHWSYDRKADGTLMNQMTDIDLVTMEYSQRTEQCLWATRGRVMYELAHAEAEIGSDDPSDPLTVFLLESVSETRLHYRLAYPDESSDDWPSDVDQAGPGKPLKFSEDYEERLD